MTPPQTTRDAYSDAILPTANKYYSAHPIPHYSNDDEDDDQQYYRAA